MAPKVEALPIPPLTLGEGPHWSSSAESLYLIDVLGQTVNRYHPATKQVSSIPLDFHLGFVTPVEGEEDKFVVGAGQRLWLLQWDGLSAKPSSVQELHALQNEPKGYQINDGKADSAGRLWFGTMNGEDPLSGRDGGVYSYSSDSGSKKHLSQIKLSNGLTWNGNNMYYIDTLSNCVDALDYSGTSGTVENRRVAFDFKKNGVTGFPDGMTVDTEGKLWVACFQGSKVIRVDPESGRLLEEVQIPTKNVTSVAWGGSDLSELIVTTGRDGEDPASGLTYRVTGLPYRGLPMHSFRL